MRLILLVLLSACAAKKSSSQVVVFDPIVGKVDQGADLIGKAPPPLDVHWLNGEPKDAGRVQLVRWWTDGCPLCTNSSPAIAALKEKHWDKLAVRAIYHDKHRGRELTDEQVRAYARTAGYPWALARDDNWAALGKWWLAAGGRKFTSVTFVLGKQGKIRLIHTGGEFHARAHTDRCRFDPDRCAAEYAAIDAAIAALVAE